MAAAPSDAAPGAAGESDLTERIMEYQRREYALLSRMAQREREMRRLRQQANEAVDAFEDTQKDSLRGAFVDPVVNIEIAMLRQQMRDKDQEIARLKEEAHKAQFQPNSIQGQKLIQKCTHLLDENAELGRQLGEERMQVLRIQLTAERTRRVQLKQRIADFDRHAEQIDAENEKMQKKITELGQNLKVTRAEIDQHKKDIEDFRSGTGKRKRTDAEKQEKAQRAAMLAAQAPGAPGVPDGSVAVQAPAPVSAAVAHAGGGGETVKAKKRKKDKTK
eukprot:CAMPEP_0115397976 /NCGR_PEP_ID=MMETSP0271-20121206/14084_1 /TAXON_ID=71861 /ORGANISM="Scrippsiella trochoidea, Strain CCMP3099" /LENGTH=275 /DNA_ID=CAMNT_0002821745 /DNA_START=30 /DNA_END=857 /DNA_ORIENTATION=+